jgi:hypothetical protein
MKSRELVAHLAPFEQEAQHIIAELRQFTDERPNIP